MWFRATLFLAVAYLAFGAIIPQIDEDMQRIVGGRNTSIFQFPWQVSLRSLRNGRHFCGGTIINRYTIVTAAHCVGNNDADAINIRVGSSFHNRSGSFRAVSRIVQHPLYDRNTTDNDIALVILSLPLFYNERVQPARLPAFEYEIENNSTVLVSGWGTLKSGDRILPTRLQFVEIQTVDQERCREAYRDMDGHSANITDNMFCAGAQGGGKDSCQGDSGGPVVQRQSGQNGAVLQGVVSWGFRCGLPTHPGVYTRVSRYLNWIEENQ